MKCIIYAALLTATALTPVSAAQFTHGPDGRLFMTGVVSEGDDARFAAALDDSVRTISLTSTGGRVYEAMAIGRIVRERGLNTEVPVSCVSSCALVWAAGIKRTAAGRVAMHCPIQSQSQPQCVPAVRAEMIGYLKEMRAPAAMIEYQEAAGSTSALFIESEKLVTADYVEPDEPPPPPPPRHPRPRYYGPPPYPPPPPPGWLVTPSGQLMPCALTLVGLPICI
jgi:hypothetical protein